MTRDHAQLPRSASVPCVKVHQRSSHWRVPTCAANQAHRKRAKRLSST